MDSHSLYDKLQVLEPREKELDTKERLKAMERPLLTWYSKHARALPWRDRPDPYRVWISEIMLQQTRVEAVKPYYERFIGDLPGIRELAAVPEDRLLKLWEGLGYYTRAKNLKKTAELLVEQYGGELPASYEELKKLPGIGSYTAGAIASIAYGIPVPAVDGNVLRVVSRVTGSREDILKQSVKTRMEEELKAVMPEEAASSYNQGLIEIGAIVCVPNGPPLCSQCPLASLCVARIKGLIGEIPVKTPKKNRKIVDITVMLLWQNGRIAIRKREDTGLLASLYEFPNVEGHLKEEEIPARLGVEEAVIAPLPAAKHVFSHVEWHMTGFWVELEEPLHGDYLWVTGTDLKKNYSLPGAFKAYTKLIR
ncbi:A/G-specific adenine glycosylase [Lacrimispora saccharolytica]|uniref:Adenine DNA glycosylase n=1 Tax=Lacrimispora saccharolytica (strain ATCC 35040 / DSM 2544 / NRCC 2533 / WM1) TaxID=610130 RepID=D9R4V2_LACSW|nr:A/G-specific adenine glycosylase [Lacrimispora saccharolytica]ADL05059.1 A/G-specific adenine glycosylase [[Clostridium] saccharolyticum WM1]